MDGNQVNYDMLKKYITKHFKIYKIEPKMPNVFHVYDYQIQAEVSEWSINQYLSKMFSVDILLVKKVFKDIAKEELQRLRNTQHSIQFEDHEGDNN
jgi:hypothetical protein